MERLSLETEESLDEVVERYADMVYRLACAQTGSRDRADDVFQEVFLRLVRRDPAFASEEHRKAWLLRVTINRCNSLLRSVWHRRTQGLEEAFPEASFTPAETGVADAVNALPKKYRQVIYLYYIMGYDTAEIAALLHRPQNTVLSQMARARAMLRKTLEGDGTDAR